MLWRSRCSIIPSEFTRALGAAGRIDPARERSREHLGGEVLATPTQRLVTVIGPRAEAPFDPVVLEITIVVPGARYVSHVMRL